MCFSYVCLHKAKTAFAYPRTENRALRARKEAALSLVPRLYRKSAPFSTPEVFSRAAVPANPSETADRLGIPPLKQKQKERVTRSFVGLVGLNRLELSTSRLSGVCSNQLSYNP